MVLISVDGLYNSVDREKIDLLHIVLFNPLFFKRIVEELRHILEITKLIFRSLLQTIAKFRKLLLESVCGTIPSGDFYVGRKLAYKSVEDGDIDLFRFSRTFVEHSLDFVVFVHQLNYLYLVVLLCVQQFTDGNSDLKPFLDVFQDITYLNHRIACLFSQALFKVA